MEMNNGYAIQAYGKINDDLNKYNFQEKTLVNISDNIYLSDENFKQRLDNIELLTDEEVEKFVREAYKLIVYRIANRINTDYLKGFTTLKFLNALYKVLNEEAYYLSPDYCIYCNMIVYDYMSFGRGSQDENISKSLFAISKLLNRNIINILLGLGLPEQLAAYIALAYRSASEDSVTIPRVNFVLLHENPSFMNQQRIVCIYERLYNSLSNLFIHTMCDVIEIDEDVANYQNKRIIYEYEADAVVAILNNMPTEMIHAVLLAFYDHCIYNNYLISNIRYSLRAMPEDEYNNARVLKMIDSIYATEGKFIM